MHHSPVRDHDIDTLDDILRRTPGINRVSNDTIRLRIRITDHRYPTMRHLHQRPKFI